MDNVKTKILESLNKIRPGLQADGGDIELIDFDQATGEVSVKFSGMCVGCPMSQYTLNEGVATQLKADVAGVKTVKAV